MMPMCLCSCNGGVHRSVFVDILLVAKLVVQSGFGGSKWSGTFTETNRIGTGSEMTVINREHFGDFCAYHTQYRDFYCDT